MQGQRRQRRGQPLSVTNSAPASPHCEPFEAVTTECFLDAGEVARIVGVSRETVLRAWRSGDLSGYAANRKVVRFTRTDVLEWLAGGRRERSEPSLAQALRPSSRSRPRRRAA